MHESQGLSFSSESFLSMRPPKPPRRAPKTSDDAIAVLLSNSLVLSTFELLKLVSFFSFSLLRLSLGRFEFSSKLERSLLCHIEPLCGDILPLFRLLCPGMHLQHLEDMDMEHVEHVLGHAPASRGTR